MLLWFLPIAITVFGAAILRGLTGFGFALAAVPLLSLLIEPRAAVACAILLQVMVGLIDIVRLHGSYDRREVARLTLGSALGMPFGIAALTILDANAARLAIALISLLGLVMMLRRHSHRAAPARVWAVTAGALSGLFGSMAAMPGPPAVVYFVATGISAARARASLMIFFFLSALLTLPGLTLTGVIDRATVLLSLAMLPFLLAGTWCGGRIFLRMDARHYRPVTIVVMILAAVVAGARAIAGLL